MSYGQLVVDSTLDTRKVEQGAEFIDTLMRGLARSTWQIPVSIDTKSLGQQIGGIKRALSTVGNLSVPVDIELKVNGETRAIEFGQKVADGLKGAEKEAKKLEALLEKQAKLDLKIDTKNLQIAERNTEEFNKQIEKSQRLIDGAAAKSEKWGSQLERAVNRANKVAAEGNKGFALLGNSVGALQGVGEKARKTFSEFLNTISRWAIGYTVVSNLISLVKGLQEATIGYNITLQRTTVSLTAMLGGNQKAAKDLLDQLQAFAVRTPFNFDDLASLTPQLLAAKIAVKDIVPTFTALGDAASASGKGSEGIKNMTSDLLSLSARGKVTGEDIRNFGHNGVNIVSLLAKAYSDILPKGTKQAELAMRDMIHKGLVPAQQGIQGIVAGIENSNFGGQMAKQASTFEGAMSNIGDALKHTLGERAFGATFQWFTEKAQQFVKIVSSPAFEDWATKMGPKIEAVAKTVANVFGTAINWGMKAYSVFKVVLGWLGNAWGAVQSAATVAWKNISAGVMLGVQALTTIGSLFNPLMAGFKLLYMAGSQGAHDMWDSLRGVGSIVISIAEGINKLLIPSLYLATKPALVIGNTIGAIFEKIPKNILSRIIGEDNANDLETLNGAFKGARKFIEDATTFEGNNQLWQGIQDKFNDGVNATEKGWNDIQTAWKTGGFDSPDFKKLFAATEKPLPALKIPEPKFGLGDLMTGGDKGKKAAKILADQLADGAKFYDMLAKASEDSAKRQLDALKTVADKFRDMFGSIQQDLAKFGIFGSSLDPMMARLQKLAGIGPMAAGIAERALLASQSFRERANNFRSRLEVEQGKDGNIPGAGSSSTGAVFVSGSSALGDQIAAAAARMQSRAASFVHQCDRLADVTVRSATTAFNKIMGPRGGDSAAKTMARFMVAGIGFKPNGHYQAGDIAYSGSRYGHGSGHVMIVGSDGRFLDQYAPSRGARAVRPTTPVEWVVRPGGAPVAGKVASIPSFLRNPMGVGNAAALQSGDDVQGFKDSITEMLKGLKIDKLALPPEWGKPVKDAAGNAHVFQAQMLLADKAFQGLLRTLYGPKKFAEIVKQMREVNFAADKMTKGLQLSTIDAPAQFEEGVRAARARGHETDPFFAIRQKYVQNGQSQIPIFQLAQLEKQVKDDVVYKAKVAVDKLRQAEQDRLTVVRAGIPFMQGQTKDLYGYTRAIELAQRRLEYARSAEMVGIFQSGDKKLFHEKQIAFDAFDAGRYDAGKGEERRQFAVGIRMDFQKQNAELQAQLGIVSDLTLGESALNDKLAIRATVLQKTDELRFSMGFGPERAKSLANEIAAQEQRNRLLQREIELQGALRQSRVSTEDTLSGNSQINALLSTMRGDDPRLEAAKARIGKSVELDRMAKEGKLGKLPNLNRNRLLGDFDTAQRSNEETARIGDTSARLAQLQYDLGVKRLEIERPLSELQRAQIEFNRLGVALTEQEATNRAEILNTLRMSAALNVDIWQKEQSRQNQLGGIFDPKTRADQQFRFDKLDAGWTDEQINAMLPVDQMNRKLREAFSDMQGLMDDWKGSWNGMFRDIAQNKFSFNSFLDSISSRLSQWGADTLANKGWELLQGLLTQFAGTALRGALSPSAKVATAAAPGSIQAGVADSGHGLFGSTTAGSSASAGGVSLSRGSAAGSGSGFSLSSTSSFMMQAARDLTAGGARQTAAVGGGSSAMGGGINFYGPVTLPNAKDGSSLRSDAMAAGKSGTANSRRTTARNIRTAAGGN